MNRIAIWYICAFIKDLRGYTYHRFRGCTGRNDIFVGVVNSVIECKSKCDASEECISFEYGGSSNPGTYWGSGYCHASSTCTYELSIYVEQDANGGPGCHLYVKKGNWYENKGHQTI